MIVLSRTSLYGNDGVGLWCTLSPLVQDALPIVDVIVLAVIVSFSSLRRKIRPRGNSSRKREKSKGGRLRRALTKVAKAATGGEDPVPPTATARGASDSNSDSDMAINPFMGTGGGQRRQSQGGGGKGGGRDGYREAGSWA